MSSDDKSKEAESAVDLANDGANLPSFGQTLRRGILLRCPSCGVGRLFRGWFRMNTECSECGFLFDRPAGYFLGSTYINYGLTALITTISYVVLHFGFGWENQVLMPGLVAFCLFFPLVFFRFARSLWLSLDSFIDRVGASEAMSSGNRRESER